MQMCERAFLDNTLSELRRYIVAVESGKPFGKLHLTGTGPVAELEEMFRTYYECQYALSFSSATNALTGIALALNLSDGEDEIIVSPYNWGSSIAGILELTTTEVIWAKSDENSNISPSSVDGLASDKTKAIWACDYNGMPHNMYHLREIADKHKLIYISDAAQSFGVNIRGKPASSLADVWVVSFGAGKLLDAGEGAIVLTNKKEWYKTLLKYQHPYRIKRELGLDYENEFYAINGRISPMAAIVVKNRLKYNHPELF